MARIDNAAASGERQGGPSDPIRVNEQACAGAMDGALFAALHRDTGGHDAKGDVLRRLVYGVVHAEPGRASASAEAKDTGAKARFGIASLGCHCRRRRFSAACRGGGNRFGRGSLSIIDSARVVAAQQAMRPTAAAIANVATVIAGAPHALADSVAAPIKAEASIPFHFACRQAQLQIPPPRSSKAAPRRRPNHSRVRRTRRRRNRACGDAVRHPCLLEHTNEGAVVCCAMHAATWPHWRPVMQTSRTKPIDARAGDRCPTQWAAGDVQPDSSTLSLSNNSKEKTVAVDSVSPSATASNSQINLQDSCRILTSQLTNQDPMKPMDNTEFMAQLAQFTSLEQTRQLNDKSSPRCCRCSRPHSRSA